MVGPNTGKYTCDGIGKWEKRKKLIKNQKLSSKRPKVLTGSSFCDFLTTWFQPRLLARQEHAHPG